MCAVNQVEDAHAGHPCAWQCGSVAAWQWHMVTPVGGRTRVLELLQITFDYYFDVLSGNSHCAASSLL